MASPMAVSFNRCLSFICLSQLGTISLPSFIAERYHCCYLTLAYLDQKSSFLNCAVVSLHNFKIVYSISNFHTIWQLTECTMQFRNCANGQKERNIILVLFMVADLITGNTYFFIVSYIVRIDCFRFTILEQFLLLPLDRLRPIL